MRLSVYRAHHRATADSNSQSLTWALAACFNEILAHAFFVCVCDCVLSALSIAESEATRGRTLGPQIRNLLLCSALGKRAAARGMRRNSAANGPNKCATGSLNSVALWHGRARETPEG